MKIMTDKEVMIMIYWFIQGFGIGIIAGFLICKHYFKHKIMSKHTPPLYALTPITDTEGLEDGWYQCYSPNEWGNKPVLLRYRRYNDTWIDDAGDSFHPVSYLRPLPEGTRVLQPGEVAVSEEELKELCRNVQYALLQTISSTLYLTKESDLTEVTKRQVQILGESILKFPILEDVAEKFIKEKLG